MRSPQGGRRTGREVLREQRDAKGTRCIRAKVPLSCHTSRGDPRRAASGDRQTRLPPAWLPAPLGLWSSLTGKKREGKEGKEKQGKEALFLWSPLP